MTTLNPAKTEIISDRNSLFSDRQEPNLAQFDFANSTSNNPNEERSQQLENTDIDSFEVTNPLLVNTIVGISRPGGFNTTIYNDFQGIPLVDGNPAFELLGLPLFDLNLDVSEQTFDPDTSVISFPLVPFFLAPEFAEVLGIPEQAGEEVGFTHADIKLENLEEPGLFKTVGEESTGSIFISNDFLEQSGLNIIDRNGTTASPITEELDLSEFVALALPVDADVSTFYSLDPETGLFFPSPSELTPGGILGSGPTYFDTEFSFQVEDKPQNPQHKTEFIVITPEEQQSFFAAPGEIIKIVADGNITEGDYSLGDVFIPSGTTTFPHIHGNEDELFYVIEGEIDFQVGEETVTVTEGSLINAPIDNIHAWSNTSENPARVISITYPAGIEELFFSTGIPVVDPNSPPSPPTDPVVFDLFNSLAAEYQLDLQDTLVFNTTQYAVNEDGNPVVPVTVLRPGNLSGDASAKIVLSNGTATEGEDYNNIEIPISFTGQERIKTVEIPLIDDEIIEENETIFLSLENTAGVETEALLQNTASLTILDNDSPDLSTNSTVVAVDDHDHDHGHEHDHDHDHEHGDNAEDIIAEETSLDEIIITPEEQELLFLDEGVEKTILLTSEETNEQYELGNIAISPGASSSVQIHNDETQAYYVLEGEISFWNDDDTFVASPGTFISHSENHGFANFDSDPATMLNISTLEEIEEKSLNEPLFGTVENGIFEINGSDELVFAGAEDDLIDMTYSQGNNRIYAGSGNDNLILGTGDRVFGDKGADSFFANTGGHNTITGGEDGDLFWVVTAEFPESPNYITDFTLSEDVIGIAGLGIGFNDLALTQNENNTLISTGDYELATLLDVDSTSLSANHFVFE